MRRRVVQVIDRRGFEGLELPRARGFRPVPEGDDFDLLQGGELPRRRLVRMEKARDRGPAAFGEPLARQGILDQPAGQNIGRSVTIDSLAGGQSVPILSIDGADETCRQLTIYLSLLQLTPTAVAKDFEVTVQFGSGGHRTQAIFDLVNGTVINLAASSIRIFVRALGTGANHLVGAFVGYGERPAGSALRGPQLSFKFGAVLAGATVTATVPSFATSFSYTRAPATAPYTIQLLTGGGTVIGEIAVAANSDLEARDVVIPNDCYTVRILNGAAALTNSRIVFGLSL